MKTNKEMIVEAVEKLEETIFIKGGKLFPSTKNEVNKILTTLLTKHEEAVVERTEKELAKVYSMLLDEFAYTGLATEEQWNESISPAFKRLINVINGRTPDSPTARVYKFPHKSTFPTPDNPTRQVIINKYDSNQIIIESLCLKGKITEQHAKEIKEIITQAISEAKREERDRMVKLNSDLNLTIAT